MPDPIYLVVASPNTATSTNDLPETRLATYLVEPQEGEETELDMVNRFTTPAMLGSELIALDPATGTRYRVDPTVVAVTS